MRRNLHKLSSSNQNVPVQNFSWRYEDEEFGDFFNVPSPISPISTLAPGVLKPRVVGALIHKGDMKSFTAKKDATEKHVIDITVRDSQVDFILVSLWGSFQFIEQINTNFQIGHIIELDGACVLPKPTDGSYQKFKPFTPSSYALSISENKGSVISFQGDKHLYNSLINIPVKNDNECKTLHDVELEGVEVDGMDVSLLAVVQEVRDVREHVSQVGKVLRRREILLYDDTNLNSSLILWNNCWIEESKNWTPKVTVLFLSDLKAKYNNFKAKIVFYSSFKTIITPNPTTRGAFLLSRYALTVNVDSFSGFEAEEEVPNAAELESIKTQMTLAEVKSLLGQRQEDLFCVVSAFLNSFSINNKCFVVGKCPNCNKIITKQQTSCFCLQENENPPHTTNQNIINPLKRKFLQSTTVSNNIIKNKTNKNNQLIKFYNLKVSLIDQTGSLSNCLLPSSLIEKMLSLPASLFNDLDSRRKMSLKWDYLLERCKCVLQICKINSSSKRKIKILSLEKEETGQYY